jgi:hypothetical protein
MAKKTTENQEPERLSQRWTLILIGAAAAGVIVLVLGGPALAALGTAGGAIAVLHQIVA